MSGQKRFKELALSFDLSDQLHLRGLRDRLGLGGDNSSCLGMGVSNRNKISSGSRGPTKINEYITISNSCNRSPHSPPNRPVRW